MASSSTNVGEYLLVTGRPDDVAVIDREGAHSYAVLRACTGALTARIRNWDLPPRSRIALLSGNSLFWVASYLAIMRAGHVAVPLAITSTEEDVRRKTSFVGCDAMLVDTPRRSRLAAAMEAMTYAADETAMSTEERGDGDVDGEGVGDGTPTEGGAPGGSDHAEAVEPDDDAALMFTSGTTSAPRAVRVSHGNIRANTDAILDYLDLRADDRVLVVLPFSYCYGASLLHTHLRVGGALVICDSFAFPETALEAIRREGCTGLAGVPSTYHLLLRASSFATTRLPSLRWMQQAGGRLAPPQVEAVAAAQPQAQLFVMYGATEATSRMSYLPPQLRHERPGSIGRGIPGVRLRIVGEDGREAPTGTVGEIFAEGDSITKGYWQDPEGTALKFVDGGLRTGDLGYADADGYIYVVDRKDDFIKSWGVRVSSREVEDAIAALPGVATASVVGSPHPDAGESIIAFYVTTDDAEITPEQVLAHCRATLARPLVPHEVRQLTEMPLNPNGKILKGRLRELATDAPS